MLRSPNLFREDLNGALADAAWSFGHEGDLLIAALDDPSAPIPDDPPIEEGDHGEPPPDDTALIAMPGEPTLATGSDDAPADAGAEDAGEPPFEVIEAEDGGIIDLGDGSDEGPPPDPSDPGPWEIPIGILPIDWDDAPGEPGEEEPPGDIGEEPPELEEPPVDGDGEPPTGEEDDTGEPPEDTGEEPGIDDGDPGEPPIDGEETTAEDGGDVDLTFDSIGDPAPEPLAEADPFPLGAPITVALDEADAFVPAVAAACDLWLL